MKNYKKNALVALILLSLSTLAFAQQQPGCYTSNNGGVYTQGYVREGNVYHYDNCVDNGGAPQVRLIEWYCDDGTAKQFRYTCPNGCWAGECQPAQNSEIGYGYEYVVCGTGDPGTYPGGPTSTQGQSLPYQGVNSSYLASRFAQMKATQAMYTASGVLEDSANSYYGVNSSTGPWCSDSDQGNFYVKGMTSGRVWSMDDNCDGADWLREWYCDGHSSNILRYKCPNGCFNGACRLALTDKNPLDNSTIGYGYEYVVCGTGDPGTYPGGPTSTQGQSLPYQGVNSSYLANRLAQMKATQAMYTASGVLEEG